MASIRKEYPQLHPNNSYESQKATVKEGVMKRPLPRKELLANVDLNKGSILAFFHLLDCKSIYFHKIMFLNFCLLLMVFGFPIYFLGNTNYFTYCNNLVIKFIDSLYTIHADHIYIFLESCIK